MKPLFGLGLRLVGLFFCALGLVHSAWGAAKPNIILIMSDDGAYSDFGFSAALNNYPTQAQTPNLDALAQQGVVASQAYAASGLCSTTRAGLLAGQYQQRFGYEYNIQETDLNSPQGLTTDQVTIAQRLKPLGYSTGAIGKWHLGELQGLNRPLDKGFDEFYGLLGGSRDYFVDFNPRGGVWKNNQFYESQFRQEGDHSKYDPNKGRYVTDAFGEEAVDFIDRHAAEENPFFLYLAFTNPHTPYQAKQADLDHFADISNVTRRTVAAMNYALDRSMGEVLDALENNNIDDNTIIVFANDQGSPFNILNPPFAGFKGTFLEGGLRVPMIIKGPGIAPGQYNTPLNFYDVLPTLVTAAGGNVSEFAHDGVDVMPFIKGEATDDPNRIHFSREFGSFAVRKGDWKLTRPFVDTATYPVPWLFNIKNNPQENQYLQAARPDIVAELTRELTAWEATLGKPKWGFTSAYDQNEFDHFVFQNNLAPSTNWSTTNAWKQGGTTNNVTMKPQDAYANGVFEFTTRNDSDYTATNDMKRLTRYTFMLNQLRLTGNFEGASDRQGMLNGNAVLFVKNLAGALPQIKLEATNSGTPAGFTFQIDNEIQLFHNLEITGNGTQNFKINGRIRDYYEPGQPNVTTPHNVRKTGSSSVTFAGNNTFAGSLTVAEGEVSLNGAAAAINGATSINVESGATFTLRDGLVKTPTLNVQSGGSFVVAGGRLETKTVTGGLTIDGGIFAPGLSTAISTISDSFHFNAGIMQMELGGTTPGTGFDQLQVAGTAEIHGGLQALFAPNFTPALYQNFEILTAGQVAGYFTSHLLPVLPSGLGWRVIYTTQSISLSVRLPGESNTVSPIGDYNLNGVVDAADYSIWRNTLNSTTDLLADGNGDHVVDQLDYAVWKSHFGETFAGMGGDFNGDGEANTEDYSIWRGGLGSTAAVDDYTTWKANMANSNGIVTWPSVNLPSFHNAVPEPSAGGMALLGALILGVGAKSFRTSRPNRPLGSRCLLPPVC